MIVGAAERDGHRLLATLRTDRAQHHVTWTLPAPAGPNAADALVATALVPAMALGESVRAEEPLSRRLLAAIPTIQDVFVSWGTGGGAAFSRVSVDANERPLAASASGTGVACFFTGGVDSFYSALTHAEELDALVFVHGFDIPLEANDQRDRVGASLRSAATQLGLPLIEVETDVRAFSDRYADWRDRYHGAALAAVALLLAPMFHRVYVPASMTFATLGALGSHPLVDPLWSTEDVELVHDGCEANRLDKLGVLACSDAARQWLRVCAQTHTGAYNCGRCEKCVRTMVAIRASGLDGEFRSVPTFDGDRVRELRSTGVAGAGATWELSLRKLEQSGADPQLAKALRAALRRRRLHDLARPVAGRARALRSRASAASARPWAR